MLYQTPEEGQFAEFLRGKLATLRRRTAEL